MHDPNHKGNVAEAAIAAAAVKLGIEVLRPQLEHGRYDLVFEIDSRFVRVQCKWARLERGGTVVHVQLAGSRHTPNGYVRSKYSRDEIDAVAVYCEEIEECYLLPVDLVEGSNALHLRLTPTRNNQRAALNWAADYRLGAVAQLEEHHGGTVGVGGSSPPSSTQSDVPPRTTAVGAHEFRNRFGWYMQRAAHGEQILINRRGKPYARLGPPAAPLIPASPQPHGPLTGPE